MLPMLKKQLSYLRKTHLIHHSIWKNSKTQIYGPSESIKEVESSFPGLMTKQLFFWISENTINTENTDLNFSLSGFTKKLVLNLSKY